MQSTVSFVQLMEAVERLRQKMLYFEENSTSGKANRRSQMTFCPKAAQALYYFITNSEKYK